HFYYWTKDIALIPSRVMPPGALVFVLTTLLDARLETALHDLLARAFQLVLVVLSPVYVMPMSRQPHQAEATARLWRLEMDLRVHQFRRLGIPTIVQESADPLLGLYSNLSSGTTTRGRGGEGASGRAGRASPCADTVAPERERERQPGFSPPRPLAPSPPLHSKA